MAVFRGTTLDDVLAAETEGDILFGLGNNDELTGLVAGVTLYGGTGSDVLYMEAWDNPRNLVSVLQGDEGNDEIVGSRFDDRIYGGVGDDILAASGGHDTVRGGEGHDILAFWNMTNVLPEGEGIRFTLSESGAGRFHRDTFDGVWSTAYSGIEGVLGTEGGDRLTGNSASNTLNGVGGNDTLRGMAGDDVLWGGDGHDTLYGGAGADLFVFEGAAERWRFRETSDRVMDFDQAEDTFVFFARNFTGLAADAGDNDGYVQAGTQIFALQEDQFAVQNDRYATTLSVRLIYDQDDGLLYYDANGALGGGPVLVARLEAGLDLTAASFALI